MKKIPHILFFLLLVPLVSCSNQQSLSQNQSETSNESGSDTDEVYPTVNELYVNDGYSSLARASVDQIYTNVFNDSGKKFVMLKLIIDKDLFNCTQEKTVYLPIDAEYYIYRPGEIDLNTKVDLTNEIKNTFVENTNLYVFLQGIAYGNRSRDYRNQDNSMNFEDLFVTNKKLFTEYFDFFLIKDSVLVKEKIPNLLLANNAIPQKTKNPFYDDAFYDGMTEEELEKIFFNIVNIDEN